MRDWAKERKPKHPNCPNCDKENSATMMLSGWGHDYPCCSDACGKRLGKRLKNGMISHEQIRKSLYGNPNRSPNPYENMFCDYREKNRNGSLRIRIKELENQLKQNGIKPKKSPEKVLKNINV